MSPHQKAAFELINDYYFMLPNNGSLNSGINSCESRYKEAIEWYKITLKQPNWLQEKYVSCLRINECYEKLKQEESGIFYLVESRKYDKTRVEGFFQLIKYYCVAGMIDIAYLYYSLIKNWYETEFLNTVDFSSYLFLSVSVYNFYLAYYMIIVYCRLDRHEEGLVMFEIISNKKYRRKITSNI